jgi:hypothetical protein
MMAGVAHFLYFRVVLSRKRGKTMAFFRSMNVEPGILNTTPCDNNFACLSGKDVCNVEPYEDRDVQLLICKDDRTCAFIKNYQGLLICTCPVNRASLIHN